MEENTNNIRELNKKLDIEKRLNNLEKEIYEQKGKISMVIINGKKSAGR
ncbi:MAG TPA: hypothetical protein VJG30_04260 [Candidatus Nanoarchaeia archaeon]|nr:hypothetical protein [Candidatus Nanoarchaeia archaeon]